MSKYDQQAVYAAREAIRQRGISDKTSCERCKQLEYCKQALRTDDLLACELSDDTVGLSHMADPLDWWLFTTHEELRPATDPLYGIED